MKRAKSAPLPAAPDFQSALEELGSMDREQLRARWADLFGVPAPLTLRPRLLMQAIAWKLQVDAEGDISAAMKRDLQVIANRCRDQRVGGRGTRGSVQQLPSAVLQPGTRLVRIWRGNTYVIDVEEDGVRWEGMLYSSLSAAAKAITGTHWNGLLFFGLRKRQPPRQAGRSSQTQPQQRRPGRDQQPVRRHG